MRRGALLAVLPVALALAALVPGAALADFGLRPGSEGFEIDLPRDGAPDLAAGSHPDHLDLHLALNEAGGFSEGDLREFDLELPAGMLANPAALEECPASLFATPRTSPYELSASGESCPDASQIGVVAVHLGGGLSRHFGVFNLTAPYGSAAAIGFSPFGMPMLLAGRLASDEATLSFALQNLSQQLDLSGLDLRLWGTPWEWKYDTQRGNCLNEADPAAFYGTASYYYDGIERSHPGKPVGEREENAEGEGFHAGTCIVPLSFDHIYSYLTLPTTCGQPLRWGLRVGGWDGGGEQRSLQSEAAGQPAPLTGCLEVLTTARMRLRTDRSAAATGIVFDVEVLDGGGFRNVDGLVRSPLRTSTALLPEGLTINPSLGAGLGTCSEAEFARESATSAPGEGCPLASKIGSVAADGLLGLPEALGGSVFLATPYANPAGSLLALYITLGSPRRGIYFRSYGTVDPDPASGRLRVTFDRLPPLHYDHFSLSLREGQRAAMISPPACGSYEASLESSPWNDPSIVLSDSSTFAIARGTDGGPCPTAAPGFAPGLDAGSRNPNASFYTPFDLRITRTDPEQEITSYSATFPPGLLGKLSGIPYCPEAAIAAARTRSGTDELAAPSCPAGSEIGHTIAGYGVGGTLAWAPGMLYLAGPYHGAPLSTVAIDSALVGPFDLGVVVVRSAIRIDPRSAQASIDSSGSDPIPHILRGIPLHLRDIRVAIDRPGFTLNPTNCDPLATLSRLTGSGESFATAADDSAATATDHFQLVGCSALGLRPRLRLALRGPHTRGGYPALRATYRPRPGDSNLRSASVALPASIFLAQEHIGEVCTLPRYRAGTCPSASRLGRASAVTPLLDEPLAGPVYLRANPDGLLPDLVAQISGRGFEIEVLGEIGKGARGGMRASFASLPDAPLTAFTMDLAGGKRSLLVNARDLCASPQFASARLIAHNNAIADMRVPLSLRCRRGGGRR